MLLTEKEMKAERGISRSRVFFDFLQILAEAAPAGKFTNAPQRGLRIIPLVTELPEIGTYEETPPHAPDPLSGSPSQTARHPH
jgi:hypothetical protein